jgi:hypothetical protein
MKKTIMLLISLALASSVYAGEYDATNIGDILIDIGKRPKVTWDKGQLSDAIPTSKIKEIILLRAVTSAPGEIDSLYLLQVIKKAEFTRYSEIDIAPIYEAI